MKKALGLGSAVLLLAALALLLAACGSGTNGTYYSESGEEYIKLDGGKWSMGETDGEEVMSGTYGVTEGKISFKVTVAETEVEVFTGEVSGNELTVVFLEEETAVFRKK